MIADPVVFKWDMELCENLALDLCKEILKIWIILNLSNVLIPLAGTSKVVPITFSLALQWSHCFLDQRDASQMTRVPELEFWLMHQYLELKVHNFHCVLEKKGIVTKQLTLLFFPYSPLHSFLLDPHRCIPCTSGALVFQTNACFAGDISKLCCVYTVCFDW